ncbi:aquaporin [Streptomyces sp. NPDC005827]|uniref:aquaporin n=1 Tax=Streptomyces sp. NPDC005827 TaxID=3157070 RepID=UPI0033E3CD26
MEFALTGGVLFVLVTAVRWVMASPLGRALPAQHLRLAAVAAMVAATLAGALSSPWGRRSGGHLNPATTLALWLTGAFPGRRVLPYVVAQLVGSVAGTGLARLVWDPVVGGSMAYAAVRPAPAWPAAAVFAAEAGATAAILAVALLLTSRPGWRRWTPVAVPAATAAVIIGFGPLTGGSANPARQFGPRSVGRPARLLVTSVGLSGGTARRGSLHRPGHPLPGASLWPLGPERPRTVARKAIGD